MRNGVQVVLNMLISLEVIPVMSQHRDMFGVHSREEVFNLLITYNELYTDLNNTHNKEGD